MAPHLPTPLNPPERAKPTAGTNSRLDRNWGQRHILSPIFPSLMEDLQKNFDGWYPDIENDTFLTCISEHDSEEDVFGRLSMWRAYGGNSGVGIVLNNNVFLSSTHALRAYSSPVEYLKPGEFKLQFDAIIDKIEENLNLIKDAGQDIIYSNLFNTFQMAVIFTNHPGFREEREWRIIYTPKMHNSEIIQREVKIIRGIPQIVQKIPLRDIPELGLEFISIPKLVDRVIIGPTQYPTVQREAFVELLFNSGVSDADKRVVVSNIPLRT
jgi:hypothetical protein